MSLRRNMMAGGGSGPPPVDEYATWNNADKHLITLSAGNKIATGSGSGAVTGNVRANGHVPATGRWYFEIGVVTFFNSTGTFGPGLADLIYNITSNYLGQTSRSWGLWGNYSGPTLRRFNSGAWHQAPGLLANGVVIGFAGDSDTGELWFIVDGEPWEGDPEAGTDPSFTNLNGTLYPTINLYTANDAASLHTDPADFVHTPPTGFNGRVIISS